MALVCVEQDNYLAQVRVACAAPCQGTGARIIETRKTAPGLRVLDKWAVLIGGGANHRMGLFDMVMIKNNHVDAAGGISPAIRACTARPNPGHACQVGNL